MNEHDRKRIHKLAIDVTKELADRGRLVEGGWNAFKLVIAGQTDIGTLRDAFYGGATHVLSVVGTLDEGTEPTEADLARMDGVYKELAAFEEDFKRRAGR